MTSIRTAKKVLRSGMRRTLGNLSTEEIRTQSKCVFDHVASSSIFQNANVVSCYLSMPSSELDTDEIVRLILQEGKILFVPKIDFSRGHIDMLRIYDEDDLNAIVPGEWKNLREPGLLRENGIPRPNGETIKDVLYPQLTSRDQAMDPSSPLLDLILMPGLAFDKTFSRLGHGKGHYDRFISNYSTALSQSSRNHEPGKMPALYALSFTEQILPSSALPITDHDWPLDDLWNECWVVTNPDARIGRRGKTLFTSPLRVLAQSLKLPNTTVPSKDIRLKNWEVPLPFQDGTPGRNVLITASFGRIIPASILRLFREEHRLNVHPSLLPLYRGPAPIQHAIADGAITTGVTISTINPLKYGVDTGDIWNAQTMEIPPDATFDTFSQTLADVGGKLLIETLKSTLTGTARSVKQENSKATTAPFIKRDFMEVDWDTWDACKLDRRHRAANHQYALRALLPYGPTLQLEQLSIHPFPVSEKLKLSAPGDAVFDPISQSIIIRCANKTQVRVTHLQQENKRVLSALDFWNGIRPEGLHNGVLKLGSIMGR